MNNKIIEQNRENILCDSIITCKSCDTMKHKHAHAVFVIPVTMVIRVHTVYWW